MTRYKRIGIALAMVAAVTTGGLAVATAEQGPPTAASQARDAFAVFRASESPNDAVPNSRVSNSTSRELAVEAPGRLFAQARENGDICLVYLTAEFGQVGCAEAKSATSVATPLSLSGPGEGDETFVVGLLPDGPQKVTLQTKDGSSSGVVRENGFAVSGSEVTSLSYTDDDGKSYRQSLELVNARP